MSRPLYLPSLTATAPADYTALMNELVVIPAGSIEQCVLLDILSDSVVDTDETFLISLDSNDPDVNVYMFETATVTILDANQGKHNCSQVILYTMCMYYRL